MKKMIRRQTQLIGGAIAVVLSLSLGSFAQEDATPPAAVSGAPDTVRFVFADFTDPAMKNLLGGESGTWEMDPYDTEQYCRASSDTERGREPGNSCLRLEYDVDSPNQWNTKNGFWTQLKTFDASSYDHLEFWARGDAAAGFTTTFKVEFKKFIEKPAEEPGQTVTETATGSYIVTGLSADWQLFSIPLNKLNGIVEWTDIRECVITFEGRRADTDVGVIYIDDLTFVDTGDFGPRITDVVHHRTKKTDRDMAPKEFAQFLAGKLYGFPTQITLKKKFPANDREFLMEIARDTWKYFEYVVNKENNLVLDNIFLPETGEEVFTEQTRVGDYTNITNVGLYLMCMVAGNDLGFIDRAEAIRRLNATLESLAKLARWNGFHYNYYDVTIFQETSNFVSYVDSGWLAAGLIVVRNAFPECYDKATQLLEDMDFSRFYDPVEGHMYHGYYVNVDYPCEYHYGAFYTEPRAISFIAIGKGDVPMEHWFHLARIFPPDWYWQTQRPQNVKVREYLGCRTETGYYEYDTIKYVPSWGGSMFEALMPTIVLDEKGLAPEGLGLNDQRHVRIQIDHAKNKLGMPVWGMSPCVVPEGGYSEYGVRPLGMKGYKPGVVTPHATFLALEHAPREAVENLRTMLKLYDGIYGEYGFYDAVRPETGKIAKEYLSLDQAMSFLALCNYLNNGSVRNHFHKDPIAQNAQKLLIIEKFFAE